MANKDTASVELIFKKKDELYEALHHVFLKLEDLGKNYMPCSFCTIIHCQFYFQ